MIRKVALLVLLFQAAACMACIWAVGSSFSSRFSLPELVQRNQSGSGLDCSAGGGGGGGGIGTGAGGFGGQQSHFHKGESFSCRISDAEQFDEAKFIQVLKESVEKDLETSGAKVVSSKNPDATSFTIEYAQGNTTGRINISGRRNPGNNCHFDADLDEKTGAK
jgi:hypothetical protein